MKEECLSKVILFGECSLRRALNESSSIIMLSAIIRGRATSCCFPQDRKLVAGSLCNVVIGWADSYATTIARRPDCMTNVPSNR